MLRIFIFVMILAAAFQPRGFSQALQFEHEALGVLEPFGNQFRVEVDAGYLPFGSHGKINVTIDNPTNHDFQFDNVTGSCSCLQTQLSSTSLSANSSILAEVTLDTAKSPRGLDQDVMIRLSNSAEPTKTINLILRFSLLGVASFADKVAYVQAPPRSESFTFRLPLLVSRDVDPKLLKFEFPKEMQSIKTQLEETNGVFAVVCTAPEELLRKSRIAGELKLIDDKGNTTDTTMCNLQIANAMDAIPSVTRFVIAEDQTFRATCLLKIDPRSFPRLHDQIVPGSIDCRSISGGVEIEAKQISPNLFRVNLKYKDTNAQTERPTELTWTVSAREETSHAKTKTYFNSTPLNLDKRNEHQ